MGEIINNATGVILAGGENTRMPVPKAFIRVDGKRIIERNISLLKTLFRETYIVTNDPGMYASFDVPLLGDMYDIRCPMTGILTALMNASSPWIFISACDMPFISSDLISYMATRRKERDAVIPSSGAGKDEPLFGFYSRRLLPAMEKDLLRGIRAISDFLKNKRVEYITMKEIHVHDPRSLSFINLNRPEDIERYLTKRDRIIFHERVKRRSNVRSGSN
jgi:molybdopterin-guanine dinucleotide biosynthesis protein A